MTLQAGKQKHQTVSRNSGSSSFAAVRRFAFHLAVAVLAFPGILAAQSKAYSLTDVLQLIQGGVPAISVLKRVSKSCISFRLTPDVIEVLRGTGASQELISGLRTTCFKSGTSPVPAPNLPPKRIVVKHDTVTQMVVRHDTVTQTIVKHDTVRVTNVTPSTDLRTTTGPIPGNCDPTDNVNSKTLFTFASAIGAVRDKRDATTYLHEVIRALADDKTGDALARNYMLGRAYVLLLTQPGSQIETTRGAVGIATDPGLPMNVFASADSAFTAVERLSPACVPLVSQWRQQQPWVNTITDALNALNAGNIASAEHYAKLALLIERRAPYAYSVLGSIAAQRKDYGAANSYWSAALLRAGTDTRYADVKRKTLFEMADASSNAVSAASPADQRRLALDAITAWRNYLGASTDDSRIAEILDRLADLYAIVGDSAAIATVYASVLMDPSKYGENTLIHAGVAATKGGHLADAVRFFEAAKSANPYSRDALYNLAISYIRNNQPQHILPVLNDLVVMDPSNPDNQLLYAYAYQTLYGATRDPELRKKYADSVVYFKDMSNAAPVKVTITEFTRGQSETTLSGTVENRGEVAKGYVMSLEFVDKYGTVVGSQSVDVGPVPAKATQPFNVKIAKGGVYGFRYKPI
jgi:Tfp pilus assembly protein PilF